MTIPNNPRARVVEILDAWVLDIIPDGLQYLGLTNALADRLAAEGLLATGWCPTPKPSAPKS